MLDKNISELLKKRKMHSDLLEFAIVLAFIFLIISIYVPRAIWDEEEFYENESRFHMENMFDVQNFYKDRFMDGGDFNFVIVGDFKFEIIEPLIEKYIGSLPSLDRKDAFVDHGIRISQSKDYIEYIEEDSKKATVMRIYSKEFDYKYKEMHIVNPLNRLISLFLHN